MLSITLGGGFRHALLKGVDLPIVRLINGSHLLTQLYRDQAMSSHIQLGWGVELTELLISRNQPM